MKNSLARSSGEEKNDIDLTPMLDVVFILLIFFIVTATFLSEKSLAIHTPDGEALKSKQNNAAVLITLEADEQLYLDGRKIDKRALSALISQKKAENEKVSFVLRAHEHASAAAYVHVADAVRNAKAGPLSLVPFNGSYNGS